jgi:AraC family transcriptional regulator
MGKSQTDYEKSINKVISFIHSNLEKNMSIEELASISNFSTFHFHRILRAFLGESLWQYVKRIRLETGAKLLLYANEDINEIAYRVGYETPAAFSTAFKKAFGISPSQFKKTKGIIEMKQNKITKEIDFNLEPNIETISSQNYIYRRLFGAYKKEKFQIAWTDFIQYAFENKLLTPNTKPFSIHHDDPKITEEDKLQCDLCIPVTDFVAVGSTGNGVLVSGKYAVFVYKGDYNNLDKVYEDIFQKWLPNSNYELGTHKLFESYLNSPMNTKPEDLVTEVYIPIQ